MKISYITNIRIPTEKAHGYQIAKMCEEFARAGHEVELIVPTRKNEIKEDLFSFYGLDKNFKIKYLKSFDFINYNSIFGKFAVYLQNLFYLIRLFFVRLPKDNLVFSRGAEIVFLFSLRGHKTVYECHSWPINKTWFFKFLAKKSDYIVTTTNYLKNIFIKNGFSSGKILVAHDGVDLKIFDIEMSKDEARKKLGIRQDLKIVAYTGSFKTMGEDKGITDIIKAIRILQDKKQEIYFWAVGGSQADIDFYENLAKEEGVVDQIKLLTKVSIIDLPIYQKAFDILLMPFPYSQHYAYYMSPLKMFEYMASYRPIIASDLPAIKEILDEENCLFCQPDNPSNLAEKILYLYNNQNSSEKLAAGAYCKVKEYSWGSRVNNIINFVKI
ncbi:MAG: glycosyltransferase [Patescibacteria group bacterium]|nr:glycosyltransferase [Patescibacteria group bacterium]